MSKKSSDTKKPNAFSAFSDLSEFSEFSVLRNANAGAAFDAVNVEKADISSQNADTGLASYNPADTRPYEQKNITTGFHKSGMATK
jgi:hypothetical protein